MPSRSVGVRSVKEECLSKLVLFGERSLQRALTEFVANYHSERNHQGKANSLLFPSPLTSMPRRRHPLPRTPRRPASILLPGRVNILTLWGKDDFRHELHILTCRNGTSPGKCCRIAS